MSRSVILLLLSLLSCSEGTVHSEPALGLSDCLDEQPARYDPLSHGTCEREPHIGPFDPVVEWRWTRNPIHPGFNKVEHPPIVANLTDDDLDGDIDQDDIPDIVVPAFSGTGYNKTGVLVAISGADGSLLWSKAKLGGRAVHAISGVAIADVDRSGEPAIFVTVQGGLARLRPDGSTVWVKDVVARGVGFDAPAISDLYGDGVPEIVLHSQVIDLDGDVISSRPDDQGTNYAGSFPADLDGDGVQEIIVGGGVLNADSTVRWRHESVRGWPAIGDLDGDGDPEIITVHASSLVVFDHLGVEVWRAAFLDKGGGPPTVADFDGDGMAEIGVASKSFYRVFEGDGAVLWEKAIVDTSSGITGSSVFDFEGDGAAEVVYADEGTLWVLDGSSGAVELEWTEHNSGTRFEYPVVVDIDGDDSAEIVLPIGRDHRGTTSDGIAVIGSATSDWVAARKLWNQHAYHIGNVNDDLTVPSAPKQSWTTWNSFRAANSETPSGLDQPDLRVGDPEACACGVEAQYLWVPVENLGLVDVDSVLLAVDERVDGRWTHSAIVADGPLLAGGMRWFGPIELPRGGAEVRLWVDPEEVIDECIEGNNVVEMFVDGCEG